MIVLDINKTNDSLLRKFAITKLLSVGLFVFFLSGKLPIQSLSNTETQLFPLCLVLESFCF